MYGALTGLSKKETAEQLGAELVQEWRGSLRSRPPAVKVNDQYWPGRDRKYADLTMDQIPLTESLLDCMERTSPIWEKKIIYEIKNGRNVLVVAHANTLRGLVKTIDRIGDEEIQGTYKVASRGYCLCTFANILSILAVQRLLFQLVFRSFTRYVQNSYTVCGKV
jgi:bisphosphoglycerate-dependent phosphoglycerate mutase family 1